jgi:hypothetical protein
MMGDQARKGEAKHRSPQAWVWVALEVCGEIRGLHSGDKVPS